MLTLLIILAILLLIGAGVAVFVSTMAVGAEGADFRVITVCWVIALVCFVGFVVDVWHMVSHVWR